MGRRIKGIMAKDRITGLVLSAERLEWTTLQLKGRTSAVAAGSIPVEPVVIPDKDDIAPESEVSVASQISKECNKFKNNLVVPGFPTEQLLLRVVDLPEVSDSELGGIVELQADKFSPFPVENMVVGYEVLSRDKEHGTCKVLVAAINKEQADQLDETFKAAGVTVERLDAAIMGWYRLLQDAGKIEAAGRQVFLFLDSSVPEVIVVQNGVPILFRAFTGLNDFEGAALYDEISEELAHTLISLEMGDDSEVATTITIWFSGVEPSELVKGLENKCGCDVKVLALSLLGAASEGVAQREKKSETKLLDLTSTVWREKERSALFKKRLIVTAVFVLLFWLGCVAVLFGTIMYHNYRLSSLNSELENWKKSSMQVRSMRRRIFMIERYQDQKTSSLECLRAVSMVQPNGVDLTSYDYKKGKRVKVSGQAINVGVVYEFKNALDANELFDNSDLIGPRNDSKRHREIFDIILALPGGEE